MDKNQAIENSGIKIKDLLQKCPEDLSRVLKNPDHPAVFEDYESFQYLAFRRMNIQKGKLQFLTEVFFIKEQSIYRYRRDLKVFEKLQSGVKDLINLLDAFTHENQKILSAYSEEIAQLEEKLFDRKVPRYFMDLWFELKRDLSRMESFFFRGEMVYKEFAKRVDLDLSAYIDDYKDIEEDLRIHSTILSAFKSRLDSLYNYHDSVKADALNKTIILLTVISGIFLPLNLIVGFFGMNTSNLFFTGEPEGTKNVLIILASVFLLSVAGLRIIKVIDAYFLRFVLGRYNFYKNLTQRLDDVDKKLRGRI